jgi:hypothetical protein
VDPAAKLDTNSAMIVVHTAVPARAVSFEVFTSPTVHSALENLAFDSSPPVEPFDVFVERMRDGRRMVFHVVSRQDDEMSIRPGDRIHVTKAVVPQDTQLASVWLPFERLSTLLGF